MAKPAELPTWTTTLANRLKPVSGAIVSGFLAGERPPASWVNWLVGMLCDWVAWFETAHDKALKTGFGTFQVDADTYTDNAYYSLSDVTLTDSPRTNPDAFSASSGGGDYIRLAASPTPGTEAHGVWLVTVEMDMALGSAATTANAVTAIELIEHASGSSDPTTGTIIARFVSTGAEGPLGRVSIRGTHLMQVTSSTSPRLSLRVDSGYSQDCTNTNARRVISVLQLSKDVQ